VSGFLAFEIYPASMVQVRGNRISTPGENGISRTGNKSRWDKRGGGTSRFIWIRKSG
jgi:hypothetical protein